MGALGTLFSWIFTPLYYAISGVLLVWHKLFSLVIPATSGWSWVLAIVGLTVTIRALLIPLFVKQIKSSRNMQLLQPKVKELQKKYGHDRERLAQETMKLYKETGTNPFTSCLPILVQMPIFLALFRLVNDAAHHSAKGFLSQADVVHISNAKLFGARLAETFNTSHTSNVKILAVVLIVFMCATQFITSRQLMSKNMPADAMTGQYAQQQKMLMYVLPFVFAISGIAFPIAAMLYWTTSNVWTMGQQFYVIRNNPSPGTPAFEAKKKRDDEKKRRRGGDDDDGEAGSVATLVDPKNGGSGGAAADDRSSQRQQPKRQTRQQRRSSGARPTDSDGNKQ